MISEELSLVLIVAIVSALVVGAMDHYANRKRKP